MTSKMSSTYFASKTITYKIFPHFLPLTNNYSRRRICPKPRYRNSFDTKNEFHRGNISLRNQSIALAKIGNKGNEEDEEGEDHKALEAVLRFYTALKNRDLQGLSDILCEECQCMSNFISGLKPLQGKQQVMQFFSSLMRSLGDNVEFIVQPTSNNGLNIGVSWRLVCKKTHAPLGKGISFHMCHVYKGKVVIRNVDMFMEPLIHVEPLRLKFIGMFIAAMNTLGCYKLLQGLLSVNKGVYVLLSLLFMSVSLFLLKLSLS